MILDSLANIRHYTGITKNLDDAITYLQKADLSSREPATVEVRGREIYYMVQRNTLKPFEGALYEAHRRYIDIQLILEGVERIDVAPLDALDNPTKPYDETGDYALYAPKAPCVSAVLRAGQFGIFFPEDAHMPGITAGEGDVVCKIVVKVAI